MDGEEQPPNESRIFRTAEDALHSDVLSRVQTFRGPSADLDIASARKRELIEAGLPRRPDIRRQPRLAQLWERHLALEPRYVTAELSIDTVLGRRNPLWRRPGDPRGTQDEPSFGPSGWGGLISRPALQWNGRQLYRPRANTVFASWNVPGIFPASDPNNDLIAGFWVGLDGWGNSQVLQAGIAVTVHPNARVEWWAWTEWYTDKYKDPPVRIDNFPISPGDAVSVLVCAPTPDHGFASLQNITTGQVTSVGINQPGSDIHSRGATAEWIVEGVSPELPVFLPVTFSSCSAGTKTTSFDLIPGGFTTEIAGTGGKNLTASSIATDTVGVVQWKGWT